MANPFSYQGGRNRLSTLAPWSKAIFLICASLASMRLPLLPLAALFAAGLAAHPATRTDFQGLGKVAKLILFLVVFSALARGLLPAEGVVFDWSALPPSLLHGLRLSTAFIFARLYYAGTKASELGDLLTMAARKLRKADPKAAESPGTAAGRRILADPGIIISLSLSFLPKTFEAMERVQEAAKTRGYRPKAFALRKSAAMLETIVFVGVKSALSTARSLETRGYSWTRTLRSRPSSLADYLLAGAGALIAILTLA